MSSKIGITEAEITASIKDIPAFPAPETENPLEAALAAMAARPAKSALPRVIFYRFDESADDAADLFQASMQTGGMAFHDVAREVDCDVQLIELGYADAGTLTPEDNARACAFGMMAAEEGTGLLIIAGFGAGSDARASKIDPARFFETATPEISAMHGAMIAAARAHIPVIAEGPQAVAAAQALRPDLRANVFICGVDKNAPGLFVFADAEKSDRGYAAIVLAALLEAEFRKRKAA